MKLVNHTGSSRYCALSHSTVSSGRATVGNIDVLRNVLEDIIKACGNSFFVELDINERRLMTQLQTLRTDENDPVVPGDDPTGIKGMNKARREIKKKAQKANSERLALNRAREAQADEESLKSIASVPNAVQTNAEVRKRMIQSASMSVGVDVDNPIQDLGGLDGIAELANQNAEGVPGKSLLGPTVPPPEDTTLPGQNVKILRPGDTTALEEIENIHTKTSIPVVNAETAPGSAAPTKSLGATVYDDGGIPSETDPEAKDTAKEDRKSVV